MSDPHPTGWVVSAQDWRGRQPGLLAKAPPVIKKWFATKEEAEAHKVHQRDLNRQPEFLLCVSPAVQKRRGKIKEVKKPSQHGAMDWTSS